MKKTAEEPACTNGREHSYQKLGTEDDGALVSRCGNCLTLRYEKDGKVEYEDHRPQPDPAAPPGLTPRRASAMPRRSKTRRALS